jgi:hypothetical protein
MADAMIEAFQRERNEWHSAAIREILGEYETWRQSSSQVPAGDVELAISLIENTPIGDLGSNLRPRRTWGQKQNDAAKALNALRALTALQVTEGDKS